ncbi:MAG: hypothetical protein ABL962_18870 [Fimbriimonadaceae bacterium]
MKRILTIITLFATLGFALPPSAEARDRDRHGARKSVVVKKRPVVAARPMVRSYYSNRCAPVLVRPPVHRHYPRRGLFDFIIRL